MTNVNEALDDDEIFRRNLGQRIVEIRRRRGLSQVELAHRLGVAKSRLNHWEKGNHLPPLEQSVKMAAVLNVGLAELALGQAPAAARPVVMSLTPAECERLAACLRAAMAVLRNAEQRKRQMKYSLSSRRSRREV
jgi:transcriptional regulator with XRE-family HTH domain